MRDTFYPASSEHIKKEKQRARKLKNTSWWQKQLSKGICYICQKKFLQNELTMEHLVPLVRGGFSVKNNVVTCCKTCNSSKGSTTIIEKRLYDTE